MLKFRFLISMLLAPAMVIAQIRYKDAFFAQISVTSAVHYGTAKTHTGSNQHLLMDIYQPQGDSALARPGLKVENCPLCIFTEPMLRWFPTTWAMYDEQ